MKSPLNVLLTLTCLAWPAAAQETCLQYFNTSWREIEDRLPEISEAGYTSLWLPPPCKGGSGTYSVGYDTFDRFDLGDKDQTGTVRTRYGTKAELLSLVEMAHRLGLRVYFDNVMAHNAGPLDPVNAGTLLPGIPGFVPEDFHLVRKPDGGWRKASDSIDYNDEWQVLNRNPFAWDIAQESPNTSFDPFGTTENADYAKWVGKRHPGRTELYPDDDLTVATNAAGFAVHPFADKEIYQDTGYLGSTVSVAKTTLNSTTKLIAYNGTGASTGGGNGKFDYADLNANGQHEAGEPCEPFFDQGINPTSSNAAALTTAWGYDDGRYNMGDVVNEDVNGMLIRSIRWLVDQTKCDGFRLDAVKHVPSYFFGEQNAGNKDGSSAGFLGGAQEQFNISRGFNDWSNHRESNFSNPAPRNDLVLFGEHLGAPPSPGDYLLAGMRIANDDFANRVGGFSGIGGNLSGFDQPGAFTFGVDNGMMYCLSHDNNYMSGSERPAAHAYMLTRAGIPIVYTDGYNISGGPDYFPKPAYIPFLGQYGQNYITAALPFRRDFARGTQNPRYSNSDFISWEFRDTTDGFNPDSESTCLLVMHARNYTNGQQMLGGTAFPANTRLRNYSPFNGPFYANVGNDGALRGDDNNIVIVPSGGFFAFSYDRPERPEIWFGTNLKPELTILQNGTVPPTMQDQRKDGANGDPAYAHSVTIPRITNGTNLSFLACQDGSAENMLLKIDGGMDANSQMGGGFTAGRDNPPGTATETFLGYEQMQFVSRVVEKFAAKNTETRNVIGSAGSETYICTLGTAGFTVNQGNGIDTDTGTASWVYHDPVDSGDVPGGLFQFNPAPQNAAGVPVTVTVKVGETSSNITNAWLYYTTDGTTYPEGSAGLGKGTTQVLALATKFTTGTSEWYRGVLPSLPAATVLRYKIGVHKMNAPSQFPVTANDITLKRRMETNFQVTGFNATTANYAPNNDFGNRVTGLKEGYHQVRTRAFLHRSIGSPRLGTSIFKTNIQTFYYDTTRPSGLIKYPSADNDTIGGSSYGFVVLSDTQTTEVWYQIVDTNGTTAWAKATEVNPPQQTAGTSFGREWRFNYTNIPNSGTADVKVRFKEASSSTNNALSDVDGWFTTLTRQLITGHPDNFRIEFPTTDGTVVSDSYVMKVYFDKALGQSSPGVDIPVATLIPEFSIFLASLVSGEPDGAVFQPRSTYGFIRNETATESALTFTFPNLYNGQVDFLHHVRVEHLRGAVTLNDVRLVKAAPGPVADSDGDSLPDYWESLHGLDRNNPDGVEGANGDPDFDGMTNYQEFLYDLGPLVPSQPPVPAINKVNPTTYQIGFPTIPNRRYRLMTSTVLGGWIQVGAYVTVNAAQNFLWNVSPSDARRFYRVEVSLP